MEWNSVRAEWMMCMQTLRWGRAQVSQELVWLDWDQMDTRLHCRHSKSHELGSNTDLCLVIWRCKGIFTWLFIPPTFSLNVPLILALPSGYSGSPLPSPRNTFYFFIPFIQGYDSCFPRRLIYAQAQCIWVVSHVILPLQCSISTEIFWRWNHLNFDSNGKFLGGAKSWWGKHPSTG